jgi:hypothetical protein
MKKSEICTLGELKELYLKACNTPHPEFENLMNVVFRSNEKEDERLKLLKQVLDSINLIKDEHGMQVWNSPSHVLEKMQGTVASVGIFIARILAAANIEFEVKWIEYKGYNSATPYFQCGDNKVFICSDHEQFLNKMNDLGLAK